MQNVDVSFIIVSYEVRGLLLQCLESIHAVSAELRIQCVVVDNASTDLTVEAVKSQFPEAEIIANSTNVGFARANNQGIQRATGTYLMLLNPDTILQESAVSALIRSEKEFPGSIVGPRLVSATGEWQRSYWDFPTMLWIVGSAIGLPSFLYTTAEPKKYPLDPDYPLQVNWVAGACLFMRRETMADIGGFSEEFFMYMEDIDLCMQARRHGHMVVYHPAAQIVHFGGASSARHLQLVGTRHWDTEARKNHIAYFRRNNGILASLCVWSAHVVGRLTKPIFAHVRRVIRL